MKGRARANARKGLVSHLESAINGHEKVANDIGVSIAKYLENKYKYEDDCND